MEWSRVGGRRAYAELGDPFAETNVFVADTVRVCVRRGAGMLDPADCNRHNECELLMVVPQSLQKARMSNFLGSDEETSRDASSRIYS